MKTCALLCPALALAGVSLAATLPSASGAPAVPPPAPAVASVLVPEDHCQVPCGIYGDRMRIDMLMEDAATIEKGMEKIRGLEEAGNANPNQLVRWIMTKDQHAAHIQEMVASYWLAQRVKAPAGEEGVEKYHQQLTLLHGITVAAMKCKQTTDPAHVARVRALALEFSRTWFSKEDLEHILSHHGSQGG